jgi:predicted nucleic acid-binding protein
MIRGVDTSFLVAAELSSHTRHSASRALLERFDEAGDYLALTP